MIEIHGLTKSFAAHVAVDQVSLHIQPGECFALLGHNGSGKTTLLKCLAGLVRPSSGILRVNGIDAVHDGPRARQAIAYLPQHAGFPEHLRVREVLEFYSRLRKLPSARVDDVLRLLGCESFAGRPVRELSGGMRQRLAIAVVCLPNAPVLLLDEPTASLDPETAASVRGILARLKAAGTTIVFATHVLADVEKLADRVAVLANGKLVAADAIGAVRSQIGPAVEEVCWRYHNVENLDRPAAVRDCHGVPVDAAAAR